MPKNSASGKPKQNSGSQYKKQKSEKDQKEKLGKSFKAASDQPPKKRVKSQAPLSSSSSSSDTDSSFDSGSSFSSDSSSSSESDSETDRKKRKKSHRSCRKKAKKSKSTSRRSHSRRSAAVAVAPATAAVPLSAVTTAASTATATPLPVPAPQLHPIPVPAPHVEGMAPTAAAFTIWTPAVASSRSSNRHGTPESKKKIISAGVTPKPKEEVKKPEEKPKKQVPVSAIQVKEQTPPQRRRALEEKAKNLDKDKEKEKNRNWDKAQEKNRNWAKEKVNDRNWNKEKDSKWDMNKKDKNWDWDEDRNWDRDKENDRNWDRQDDARRDYRSRPAERRSPSEDRMQHSPTRPTGRSSNFQDRDRESSRFFNKSSHMDWNDASPRSARPPDWQMRRGTRSRDRERRFDRYSEERHCSRERRMGRSWQWGSRSRTRSRSHASRTPSPWRLGPHRLKTVRLHIKGLTRLVTKAHIVEIFGSFGPLTNVDFPMSNFNEGGRHDRVGRGFAFVEYAHPKDCESALKKMDGGRIDNKRIIVSPFQSNMLRMPLRRRHPSLLNYRW